MGCATCKNKKSEKQEEITPVGGGKVTLFLIKLMSFIVVIALLPFIIILLLYMVFVNLFLPKKDTNNMFNTLIDGTAQRFANRKIKKEEKRREKEFENNRSYKGGSELLDIEVFTNEEDDNTEVSG